MTKKTTLSDISRNTGYSVSTISRVLNGRSDGRISERAVAVIKAEAERCNYSVRPLAQILHKSRTRTIGVVLPSVTNPFFAEMCSSIIHEAGARGYSSIVMVTLENEEEQSECISSLLSKKVDGILAAPCGNTVPLFEKLNGSLPVVLVDRFFLNRDIPYVTSNNFKGAYDATMMLINNGHRNIVCIQGDADSLPNRRRLDGFESAMKAAGCLDSARIVGDGFSVQNGYLETKLLLNLDDRPTAIFALSYTITLGVMKALRDSSLMIGKDISLVSFDDNMSLDYMYPPITRVSQATEEMGKLAARVLINEIEGNGGGRTPQLELSTELVIRDSVCNIN